MDKYDTAIEYLTENPEEIEEAWTDPAEHEAGCLFEFVRRSRDDKPARRGVFYGCLTQIRYYDNYVAFTPELTAAIKADDRIPESTDITVEDLPVFAAWQRTIDRFRDAAPGFYDGILDDLTPSDLRAMFKEGAPVKEDEYDEAVAYLTRRPEEILDAWSQPRAHEAGCLFRYADLDPTKRAREGIGCLTMIRREAEVNEDYGVDYQAFTPELTAEIMADTRIPTHARAITVESLPVFAEWQRRLDAERAKLAETR